MSRCFDVRALSHGVRRNNKGEMVTMAKHSGRTEDAGAPILGAKFWKKGVKLSGRVIRQFGTENGPCYELELSKSIKVNGKDVSPESKGAVEGTHFSVGNMKGFGMALAAAGLESLQAGDMVAIECVGETDTGKGNPRVDFQVDVDRPDEKRAF